MYINRKDGTLVEAEKYYSIGLKRDGWIVKTDNNTLYIPAKDFQGQYGEAMICPDKVCYRFGMCNGSQPHLCSKHQNAYNYHCPKCIPYIPEEQELRELDGIPIIDPDDFPKKDLLIDDEKICEVICGKKKCENTDCSCFNEAQRVLKAELAHLAKLGIVYAKEEISCKESNKSGKFWIDGEDIEKVCGNDGTCVYREYIPLSDYMKQMEAKE